MLKALGEHSGSSLSPLVLLEVHLNFSVCDDNAFPSPIPLLTSSAEMLGDDF